jgi:hypothetical protein
VVHPRSNPPTPISVTALNQIVFPMGSYLFPDLILIWIR